MSFKIACLTHEKATCFQVFGGIANHLDSIALYVMAKAAGKPGVVLDIRAVTTRPGADKVFIHILKYPTVCLRKIALVDVKENRRYWLLYERLVRTRGYQVRFFGDIEMASEWLSGDDAALNASRSLFSFASQVLTVLRQILNSTHPLHATSTSR